MTLLDKVLILCMSLCHSLANISVIDWVSLVTAWAMVLARVVSLDSWSWLWSLLASVEIVASPSLVLSLFPIMCVCMVLKGVEVSQIIKCSFVPYIQLCCAGLLFKSCFKSIKINSLLYISNMLWQMVSKEV